jgi:hypothetical protein
MKTNSRSVRIGDDTYRQLIDLSRTLDRPISRVIRAAVDAYQPAPIPTLVEERAGASKKPWAPPGPSAESVRHECPHPPERRKTLRWGTVCGVCGTVLR